MACSPTSSPSSSTTSRWASPRWCAAPTCSASAPRQALLARLLGGTPPRFAHVPLVVAADGSRLAKRAPGVTLRDHRDAGASAAHLVDGLARLLGLARGGSPAAMLATFDRSVLSGRATVRLPLGGLG